MKTELQAVKEYLDKVNHFMKALYLITDKLNIPNRFSFSISANDLMFENKLLLSLVEEIKLMPGDFVAAVKGKDAKFLTLINLDDYDIALEGIKNHDSEYSKELISKLNKAIAV
ncbi:hypothetical protein K4M64_004532 [Salmonella enterica]|nr:hypothetical protein [Salmonella enterica]